MSVDKLSKIYVDERVRKAIIRIPTTCTLLLASNCLKQIPLKHNTTREMDSTCLNCTLVLHLHSTPLKNTEFRGIGHRRVTQPDNIPPELRLLLRSGDGFVPLVVIPGCRIDSLEDHEDAKDDVWCWRDIESGSLLVFLLRHKT